MPTYFTSDLHLFSRRSRDDLYAQALERAANQARRLILGGDIIDFRWSTLASFDETVKAAEKWLTELVGPRPQCDFHYILGNHDCHPEFIHRLEHLGKTLPNFRWHNEYLRLEKDIFLHGDVVDGPSTSQHLAMRRARWARERPRGAVSNALYDAAVSMRLHRVAVRIVHPHKRVARRLLAYLDHVGHGPNSGIRRVFFGHTHSAVDEFAYADVMFYNGGAPMSGLKYRVLQV